MYLTVRILSIFRALALCLLVLLVVRQEGRGQRILHFADATPSSNVSPGGLLNTATISDLAKSIDPDPRNFATMMVYATLGTSSAYIHLNFPSVVPSGTTIYIRLSGSSVGLLNDLGGDLSVVPYNGTNELTQYSTVRDLVSAEGSYYWTVTAMSNLTAVRINIKTGILLDTRTINVHHAFYITGEDNCHSPLYSTIAANGLTLDLLGGGAKVINPSRAIDSDPNNYSELSLGSGITIGLGNSVYQDVYFPDASPPNYGFRIFIRSPQSVLNLALFSGIKVSAFNDSGSTVFQQTLDQVLGIDLLGLAGGKLIPVDIYPPGGESFNKIRVELGKFLDVNVLAAGLYFYGVQYIPPPPDMSNVDDVAICEGNNAVLTIPSPNSLMIYHWYDETYTYLNSGVSITIPSGNLSAAGSPYIFYVAAEKQNCDEEESAKTPITVAVYFKPEIPHVNVITNSQY